MRSMLDGSVCRRLNVLDLVRPAVWALLLSLPAAALATPPAGGVLPRLTVVTDAGGSRLQVDGRNFMVLGLNWDYTPIGENYNYSLWTQPDDVITAALAREMPLLQAMGVNTIRQYVGVPPRWVKHIYEQYGIFTILNHTVGRYGLTVDGVWKPSTDYSDPQVRAMLKADLAALADQYRGTPGVLMWLLGNENNYGLSWKSAETEALPEGERDIARARYLYSLFGEIIRDLKQRDPEPPGGHGQRRPAVHRPDRRVLRRSGRVRLERLPRHLGARLLPGRARQAGHPDDVHRVRLRRLQRPDDERGPGDAGALPAGPVARDLRAVGRQGPRRQRRRRPDLPVERRLVEVPAG